MKIDQSGIDFIKSFESFSPVVYQDIRGKYTIGWGHTVDVTENTPPITEEEGTKFLEEDLDYTEKCIANHVKIQLSQWEYNALCSLVFNIGPGNFIGSSLLKILNFGDKQAAAREFDRWDRYRDPNTKQYLVCEGLQKRRALEKSLFLSHINSIRSQSEA